MNNGLGETLQASEMVGIAGFEPTTPTPPVWCATRLRYIPIQKPRRIPELIKKLK